MSAIRLDRIGEAHLRGVAEVARRQEGRWRELDGRLREPRKADDIVEELEGIVSDPEVFGVVAVDGRNREVVGCSAVWIRELPPESEALAFLGARDGVVKVLALPGPDDAPYDEVAGALLGEVGSWWDEQEATGANFARPICDTALGRLLEAQGWEPVFDMAFRPSGPLRASTRPALEGLEIRFATPADVEAVVALHLEEYGYHATIDPSMRMVPGIEVDIRENIAQSFEEREDEVMRRRVFVVEYGGEPVATSITFMYLVGENGPGIYAPGKYFHMGSTGVRGDMRGKGVGRALVEGILRFYEPIGVEVSSLWYHTQNPLSSTFWPRLGWVPVARRWRRRRR